MSRVDDVFGGKAQALIAKWGSDITVLRKGAKTYSSTTGEITTAETPVTARVVFVELKQDEFNGIAQEGDMMFMIAPETLNGIALTQSDFVQYTIGGSAKTAKVVQCRSVRGDNAVLFTVIVRPQ